MSEASARQFETTVESDERDRVFIAIPFDPGQDWGKRARYYVRGMLNATPFHGSLGARQGIYFMPLNKELREHAGIGPGDTVRVVIAPDEAQTEAVPADFAARLTATPEAGRFFDTLSAFYRNAYVTWIEGAKTPATRMRRLDEAIGLLAAHRKQR